MKISEVISTLMAEKLFRRTPMGRPLTDFAIDTLNAALEDIKNQNQDAIRCLNCGLITSSLLVSDGCVCGSKDLTLNITKSDIL